MVLAVGGFDAVGEATETFREREETLEESGLVRQFRQWPTLFARHHVGEEHDHPDVQPRIVNGSKVYVAAGLLGLPQRGVARAIRNERGMFHRAVSDDETLRTEQRELGGAAREALVFQAERNVRVAGVRELRPELPGPVKQIEHARVERCPAEVQGVVQRLLDAHVEPGIDALVQELQREHVDDDHRGYRERHEHRGHAPGEPGARLALSNLAQQAEQVVSDQRGQGEQPGQVHHQQHRVEPVEARRALRRIGHQPERREEQDERREGEDAGLEPLHDDSTQVNQSSRRRHNERNQASGRSGEGMASMSRRARRRAR